MKKHKDGGAAFPYLQRNVTERFSEGMTLRDYFAAAAMQSVLKSCGDLKCYYEHCAGSKGDNSIPIPSSVAAYCFELADAMLAERSEGGAS
jgi:hypothetical protein